VDCVTNGALPGEAAVEIEQRPRNAPVQAPLPDYAFALVKHLRDTLARAYINTQQKWWDGSGLAAGRLSHGLTPLPPGIEWRLYYNYGGDPTDPDWDQAQADAPNLSFEGVEIRWYKSFGRDMKANVNWGPDEWVTWFQRCLLTVLAWEAAGMDAQGLGFLSFERPSLPDPAGRVRLPLAD
jgi:hypothetical protein